MAYDLVRFNRPVFYRFAVSLLVSVLLVLGVSTAANAQDGVPEMPQGDFRVVFTEAFLVEQLETQIAPFIDNLSAYGFTISDPEIDLRDDNRIDVTVTTDVPLGSRTLTVRPTVTVALSAADNEMSIAIEEISMEGLSLPTSLLGEQLETVQAEGQVQINELLTIVERLGGIELAYVGITEDLLVLDFNFDLTFDDLGDTEE